ncbi:aminotransferase family protein [Metabacillus sp. B2-18]|uniref:aminotransferase family protein n=1 Tax=Metabacillus sp. B2-18 TaxID=2897333 RepID=UPI001E2CBC61|nr:aspartate aminotransferase family protein [Metabacillus sp. B2-18]UGB32230.1 aspartate aminotransferase family protein [Metabacillus sp. B2-18]
MKNELKQRLVELDKKHFLHPTSSVKQQQENGPAFIFEEGYGIYLKDIEGKEYIEGMSSLWNVAIGYGRKELGEVAMEQINKLSFSSAFSTFSHEPAIRLAEKLAHLAPGDLNTVFFTSGGSEANDSAFKLARYYWILKGEPNRKKIISRKKAYHGVATGATSATGIPEFHRVTNSLAPDFVYAEPMSAESLREVIEEEGPRTVAAFIAEPVMGAGGLFVPTEDYFKEVRSICDEYGILFIADEVITGFGRTGKMFALENWDVVPDMMSFAKGVTSGYFPLGGVMISEKIFDVLKEKSTGTLFHGFTYSGHPVACQVGLKNLEIMEKEGIVENCKEMEGVFMEGFKRLEDEFEQVGDTRIIGLLGGFEFYSNRDTKERFTEKVAPRVMAEAAERGLICRCVIYNDSDTLVIAPPLIITKPEVEKIISILKESIAAVVNKALV